MLLVRQSTQQRWKPVVLEERTLKYLISKMTEQGLQHSNSSLYDDDYDYYRVYYNEFDTSHESETTPTRSKYELYVQPILLVVGLICNMMALIVVLSTPSLRRQSRGVYVVVMAVLDNWMIICIVVHHVISTADTHHNSIHACRYFNYTLQLALNSRWLLVFLVCETSLARTAPRIWRKLSTPTSASILSLVLVVINACYNVPAIRNIVAGHGYCHYKDLAVLRTIHTADLVFYFLIPVIVLAAATLTTCIAGHSSRRSTTTQQVEGQIHVPYQLFRQVTPADQDGGSPITVAHAAYNTTSIHVAVCVYILIFVLPVGGLHVVEVVLLHHPTAGHHFNISENLFLLMDFLYLGFYLFKLFVYVAGWKLFRASCVDLVHRVKSCVTGNADSGDQEADLALNEIVPESMNDDLNTGVIEPERLHPA